MDFRDYSLKDLVNNVQTKQMSAKEVKFSKLCTEYFVLST